MNGVELIVEPLNSSVNPKTNDMTIRFKIQETLTSEEKVMLLEIIGKEDQCKMTLEKIEQNIEEDKIIK